MQRLNTLFIATLLLAACGHSPEPDPADIATDAAEISSLPHTPRIVDLPFRLDVTVSAEASQALDAAKRKLSVKADYYGHPRNGSAPVRLGEETRQISVRNQSVTLAGEFDAALAARDVTGDPHVKVTASTSGENGPVLYCTEFDEALTIAVESGGYIHCELLEP